MKPFNVNAVFPLGALVLLVFALSRQMAGVPPLGKLLDPFAGVVQNENEAELYAPELTLRTPGLRQPVEVYFDGRKVPHIYARNTPDLYFAQGYVTARLRLWQMDFLTYAAAGRLSEIFPEGFLDYDRNQRRIGMLAAAKASLRLIEADPETRTALTAYTAGVNACIRQLRYKTMPFEYKLLDYAPEPWSNLKSVLVMKHMGNTLSGYEEDLAMTHLMLALGESTFNRLFPQFPARVSPVVSDSPGEPNPALTYLKKPAYLDYAFWTARGPGAATPYNPKLGSNSWAVSGRKTRSGRPILCSDPHLNLALPAVWLEMQLSAPGLNVYGVSIPGTPAVIIGFNRHIAWGLTNGQDDVKDWYKLELSGDARRYRFDGQWRDLGFTVEAIKRRSGPTRYDTVYHTVHGPIVHNRSFPGDQPALVNHALKWELHRPSNEFRTFLGLNRATGYRAFAEAIRHYGSPIQNFTFASRDNDIAVHHQGRLAVKGPGQGKFILDGTRRDGLPTGYVPAGHLPHVLNPPSAYVLSANQHPTGANYAYYYNGYFSENRANRIRQLLERENAFDVAKMQAMQLDNTNAFAVDALPVLVRRLPVDTLSPAAQATLAALRGWNGAYAADDPHAGLFELWWKYVKQYTWDEWEGYAFAARVPDDYVLLDLIDRADTSAYFDRQGTAFRERAGEVVGAAFAAALAEHRSGGGKRWGDYNRVHVMHMTNLKLFSHRDLPAAGHPEAINATSTNWGPSWRMVVELGDRPRAFGVYAGGQSGNVGSAYFDNFLDDWRRGRYFPLAFYLSAEEAHREAGNVWRLEGREMLDRRQENLDRRRFYH